MVISLSQLLDNSVAKQIIEIKPVYAADGITITRFGVFYDGTPYSGVPTNTSAISAALTAGILFNVRSLSGGGQRSPCIPHRVYYGRIVFIVVILASQSLLFSSSPILLIKFLLWRLMSKGNGLD
jgi:hypothetical protein